MAWIGTVTIDKDKTDVGSATAIYTEGEYTFSYSRRIKMTIEEKKAFITEAKEALLKDQTLGSKNTSFSSTLTTELNA